MPLQENSTIIIADDLTGANDTALQYFSSGIPAKIIIDSSYDINKDETNNIEVFAYSTESRNLNKEEALNNIVETTKKIKQDISSVNFYKKIDSTLRGNVGIELVALLEIFKKDAAIIAPAYIEENRTTIGSYQLLNGIPIERTQAALDPKAPITESYIPNILKKDINPQLFELIGSINFDKVAKGAGPISLKIKELIQKNHRYAITPPSDSNQRWQTYYKGRDGKRKLLRAQTKEELIDKLVNFSGEPQKLGLPSAPKQFIQYLTDDNRPQVKLDVDYEGGMGVSIGRLREDTVYDWKFVGLAHNTLRGAAGGAVLCAELLKAKGYLS